MHCRWDGESFRNIFDQMKWPFLLRELELVDGTRLHLKPWMIGIDKLLFMTLNDAKNWEEALKENWNLMKDLVRLSLSLTYRFRSPKSYGSPSTKAQFLYKNY